MPCRGFPSEARRGAVLLTELTELIGPTVVAGVHPEPVAEVRYLNDHRLVIE